MSACTANTSVNAASNGCCQRVTPVLASISSGLTRTRLRFSALLPAHRAGEQVADAELRGDLGRRLAAPLVLARAASGDDLEARQPGQLAAELVGHAVGEVGVGAVAQVGERQHGEPGHGLGVPGATRRRAASPDAARGRRARRARRRAAWRRRRPRSRPSAARAGARSGRGARSAAANSAHRPERGRRAASDSARWRARDRRASAASGRYVPHARRARRGQPPGDDVA